MPLGTQQKVTRYCRWFPSWVNPKQHLLVGWVSLLGWIERGPCPLVTYWPSSLSPLSILSQIMGVAPTTLIFLNPVYLVIKYLREWVLPWFSRLILLWCKNSSYPLIYCEYLHSMIWSKADLEWFVQAKNDWKILGNIRLSPWIRFKHKL